MEVAASRAAGGGSAARVATETPIDGDDTMLARKVLARIETGSGPAWSSPSCRGSFWPRLGWRPALRPFS